MPIGSDIQITLSDLDLRIGVELRHSNNDALIGWASGTLGSSSVTVDLNGVLNIDEIDVKFFLTDKTKGLWDSDVNEVRYSMPRGKVANEIPIIINRFWYNVTVVDDDLTPSPYFQIFTAAQTGALLNQIKIDYKPRGYVGTCEVTVRKKSNNQRLCDFQFEITDGWANGSYLYTLAGGEDFEEGVTYVAKARLPNYSQPLLVVGEDEFITFTTVP